MQYFKTEPQFLYPTLLVNGTVGTADPCYIIPKNKWSRFVKVYCSNSVPPEHPDYINQKAVFVFDNIPFYCYCTNGDGCFNGLAVDSGTLAVFPLEAARKTFGFDMIPIQTAK